MSNLESIREILKRKDITGVTARLHDHAERLGTDIAIGIEGVRAYKDRLKAFERCAASGMPEAWISVGLCHIRGQGVKANRRKGAECFLAAYRAGFAEAGETYLNYAYFELEDYDQVNTFCSELLAAGDATGLGEYYIGLMKYSGNGCKADAEEAFGHHTRAAGKGLPDAMFELYVLLSTGQGCGQDDQAALAWCRKAADAGQKRACYNLGSFYATGRGVEQDVKQSYLWYREAADRGHGKAAATIGVMLKTGELELQESDEDAEFFFRLAEENNFYVDGFLEQVGVTR